MAYFSVNRISEEERQSILSKHREPYNGYQTLLPNSNNTQQLYVQDYALDKVGVTVTNKGDVKPYTNYRINEGNVMDQCEQCSGDMVEGECSECGWKMEEVSEDYKEKIKKAAERFKETVTGKKKTKRTPYTAEAVEKIIGHIKSAKTEEQLESAKRMFDNLTETNSDLLDVYKERITNALKRKADELGNYLKIKKDVREYKVGKLSDIKKVSDLTDTDEFDYVDGNDNYEGSFEQMHHMKKLTKESGPLAIREQVAQTASSNNPLSFDRYLTPKEEPSDSNKEPFRITDVVYLKTGDKDGLKRAQHALYHKGFLKKLSDIDGFIGPITTEAIKKFQIDTNAKQGTKLPENGKLDSETEKYLYRYVPPFGVRKHQIALYNKGFLSINDINGEFDKKTQDAVIEFQKKNNINPTGIIDQYTSNNLTLGEMPYHQGFGSLFDTPKKTKFKTVQTLIPTNKGSKDVDMVIPFNVNEQTVGGGNAPDFDIDSEEPAFNFKSKGPKEDTYTVDAPDMDLDYNKMWDAYDFESGGSENGGDVYPVNEKECEECWEKMESAFSDGELDEVDVSGVQGMYGDMDPAYNFVSTGAGKAGPYQTSDFPQGYSGENEDAYWELEQGELNPDKIDRDLSWEEITASTGEDEFSNVSEEKYDRLILQKNKINEMIERMQRFN